MIDRPGRVLREQLARTLAAPTASYLVSCLPPAAVRNSRWAVPSLVSGLWSSLSVFHAEVFFFLFFVDVQMEGGLERWRPGLRFAGWTTPIACIGQVRAFELDRMYRCPEEMLLACKTNSGDGLQ